MALFGALLLIRTLLQIREIQLIISNGCADAHVSVTHPRIDRKKEKMKKGLGAIIFALGLIVLSLMLAGCAIERVQPGEIGIRVDLTGEKRTIEDSDIVVGRITYNPITTDIIRFTVNSQRVAWTADPAEGSPKNEEITFNSQEGLRLKADVAVDIRVSPDQAVALYERYRLPFEQLVDTVIRDHVRNAIVDVAEDMSVENIIGSGQTQIVRDALPIAKETLAPLGIELETLTILGGVRAPDEVVASIQAKARAQQDAITAKSKADEAREQAQGESDAAVIAAQGEAEALKIRGESLRANPEILQLEYIQKWDGVLPNVVGGDNLQMLLPSIQQEAKTGFVPPENEPELTQAEHEANAQARLKAALGE